MFRIITESSENPHLVMVCDHPHCLHTAKGEVPVEYIFNMEAHQSFANQLSTNNWLIALHGQFCPSHSGKSQIIIPGMSLN